MFWFLVKIWSKIAFLHKEEQEWDLHTEAIMSRTYIADSLSFGSNSEWEGVYANFALCDANSISPGYCTKEKSLNIYGCIRNNRYNYEDDVFICKLGQVMTKVPNKADAQGHMICDTTSWPGEVEIEVKGNKAFPRKSYYAFMCGELMGDKRRECERNVSFSLTKEAGGVQFSLGKGLDKMTCETPINERFRGTLGGFYPQVNGKSGNGSFDCAKGGLSIA